VLNVCVLAFAKILKVANFLRFDLFEDQEASLERVKCPAPKYMGWSSTAALVFAQNQGSPNFPTLESPLRRFFELQQLRASNLSV
jgi:hypothetical protein